MKRLMMMKILKVEIDEDSGIGGLQEIGFEIPNSMIDEVEKILAQFKKKCQAARSKENDD